MEENIKYQNNETISKRTDGTLKCIQQYKIQETLENSFKMSYIIEKLQGLYTDFNSYTFQA